MYNWWKVEQQISRIESKKSNLSWPIILKTISSDVKILRCITKFPAVTPTYVVFDSWLFVGIHYYDWCNVSKAKYLSQAKPNFLEIHSLSMHLHHLSLLILKIGNYPQLLFVCLSFTISVSRKICKVWKHAKIQNMQNKQFLRAWYILILKPEKLKLRKSY